MGASLSGGDVALVVCSSVVGMGIIITLAVIVIRRLCKRYKRASGQHAGPDSMDMTRRTVEPRIIVPAPRGSGVSQKPLLNSQFSKTDESTDGLSSSPAVTDEISNLMRSTSSTTSHVKTYRVNSSSSNGTVPLDKQVSGSLHLCAEAVADVARRKAIEESACDRDLETTLPISKIETLPEKEAHRPRSITEVVAAKRDNARRRVQHRQQAIERSKTAREANPDVAKKASAATKRKLKKERSLSLPVISIEGNCAVSFLFSDGESSDSDGGGDGKVANPYFNMCKLSPSPTPTGRKGHSSPEDGSGNAQSGDLNPKDGVEMASSVQAGVVQVLELTMSDPENDYDSAEADNIFLDALADSAARKKLKHKVAMYVDVDPKEDAQSAASTRRSVSLQHVTQNEGWEAGTAPGTPPQSDGTWKRGARFKRSRRGSKKQRVRVVSRAVTFHSHAQSPQLVPAISFQTTSLQSISKKYPSSGVVVQKERRGSVVEVSPADMEHEDETTSVTDMQTSPDSEAAVNSDHVQLSIARKANGSHGTARNHVQVPANSPVSENDLCNGAESHSSAAIAKHILKAKGLPMVTGQQRRKKREELRKKLVAITPRRRNSLSSPTSMTPTVPEESIAVAWTNGSTPMDSAIPRLSALDYVANNDTDGSLSPESVLSSDLPMDVYGTKPQGVPYCPLVDLESPLKSSERESPV